MNEHKEPHDAGNEDDGAPGDQSRLERVGRLGGAPRAISVEPDGERQDDERGGRVHVGARAQAGILGRATWNGVESIRETSGPIGLGDDTRALSRAASGAVQIPAPDPAPDPTLQIPPAESDPDRCAPKDARQRRRPRARAEGDRRFSRAAAAGAVAPGRYVARRSPVGRWRLPRWPPAGTPAR